MKAPGDDAIVPFPAPRPRLGQAQSFRSTWIVASLGGLREAGLFEQYLACVPSAQREELTSCVAGVWLPMRTAYAHYAACDQLNIPQETYLQMARASSDVRTAWNRGLITKAERDDATPWSVLPSLERAWTRTVDGDALGIFREHASEARLEYVRRPRLTPRAPRFP